MEGDSFGGGQKRRRDEAEGSRPEKVRRQGDGESSVVDGMFWEASLVQMGCDPMKDLSFPLSKSGPVFLNASSQATTAFDFSELTGALLCNDNESIGSNEVLSQSAGDALVRRVEYTVQIPKQMIFKEVLQRLNLRICNMGLVVEAEDPAVYSAWIEMETPPCGSDGNKGRKKLYGLGCGTRHGAIESVCAIGVMHLRMHYNVIVKDFSYARMKMLEGKFMREKKWCSMITESFQEEKKKTEKANKEHRAVVDEVLCMCKEFSDILPIHVLCGETGVGEVKDVKVAYGGPRPAVSRLEELAFALVKLASNGGVTAVGKI